MHNVFLLTAATLFLGACIGAGINSPVSGESKQTFPQLTGIDLTGEERALPSAFKGSEYNLVTVAFEREQQEEVDTWIPYAEGLEDNNDSLRYYEVPLIYEVNPAYRWWINNGMRSGIPSERARERTITVYTDRKAFLNMMDMQTDRIYTLLLDQQGKVLWRVEGPLTEPYKKDLEARL